MRKTAQSLAYRRKGSEGFTLIELLVVIAIIAILATVIYFVINPFQIRKESNDTNRMADLATLQSAISLAMTDATGSAATVLCYNTTAPCIGASNNTSDPNNRKNDGSGWVKVNFAGLKNSNLPVLPVDPINNSTYHYTYQTNSAGDAWEVDAVLESDKYTAEMSKDGGNNDNAFEKGSSLTVF